MCFCAIVCYTGCVFNICHLESLNYNITGCECLCLWKFNLLDYECIIFNVLSSVLRIVSCLCSF